jgi:tRNA-Thr(GGU) m(6)t(6)A37 methyltransferase TsaA
MVQKSQNFIVQPIGYVSSPLTSLEAAPKQGWEGSPEAWLVFKEAYREGLRDLGVGSELIVITWLDQARRDILRVHPRRDPTSELRGVFSTRSPHRPNPIGIHRVKIISIEAGLKFQVSDLEALDKTPIIDVKPVQSEVLDA